MSQKNINRVLDKFYTNRKIIPSLLEELNAVLKKEGIQTDLRWIEPSAGDGSFLDFMPENALGFDILPARNDIVKQDFLLWQPENLNDTWIVFGNPPFGKNSSLAISFFNHSAKFAKVIAFIVPRTFEKISVQNRLDLDFNLKLQKSIDNNSFLFEGKKVCVPCVFQVWVRDGVRREKIVADKHHDDFKRVKDKSLADFAFQRVGVAAGKVKDMDHPNISPSSHHFIRVNDRKRVEDVKKKISNLDFSQVKYSTAGNPSISLSELIDIYKRSL